ncbi:MAG: hypothetical protein QHC40_08285 [Sphingobium sp.]|nr:hypothetical protein [Sphingobium sp.]
MRGHSLLAGAAGAAALLLAAGLAESPAMARKALNVGPPIAMSDSFRMATAAAQTALSAGDIATASARIAQLSPANDFEIYVAAGLRFELAARRGDIQAQRIALTDMFKSSAVPPGDAPRLRYLAGLYSFYVGNYDDTMAQLNYAKTLGYEGVDATLLMADTYIRRNKPKDARAMTEQAFTQLRAEGKPIPAAWYDKAISLAYQTGDWAAVGMLYRERLAAYPSTGNWRSALVNYGSASGLSPQIQLDLYRLQAANGAMASERDYQSYAQLAEKNGNNAEAKAIVEAGRAAGKLSPTQATTVKLMKEVTPKATKEIAALPTAAKKAAAASDGSAALNVADSYFALSQFPQAVEQYRAAIAKGGIDLNRANTRLGVALARSGDLANARLTLAQAGGEWSNLAGLWSVWVDQQASRTAGVAPPASVTGG